MLCRQVSGASLALSALALALSALALSALALSALALSALALSALAPSAPSAHPCAPEPRAGSCAAAAGSPPLLSAGAAAATDLDGTAAAAVGCVVGGVAGLCSSFITRAALPGSPPASPASRLRFSVSGEPASSSAGISTPSVGVGQLHRMLPASARGRQWVRCV